MMTFRAINRTGIAQLAQRLAILLDVVLVLALAWLAAQLTIHFLEPTPKAVSSLSILASPARNAVSYDERFLTDFNPFQNSSVTASVDPQQAVNASETTLDLTLVGVRQDLRTQQENGTRGGSAIIKLPDGQQRVFQIDHEILDGVQLEEVGPVYVLIRRRGVLESLYLPGQTRQNHNPQTVRPDGQTIAVRTNFAALLPALNTISMRPERRAGQLVGWRLPENLPAALKQIELQGGDLITHLNNAPFKSVEDLQDITGLRVLTLRTKRDGENRTIKVQLDENR